MQKIKADLENELEKANEHGEEILITREERMQHPTSERLAAERR